MDADRPTSHGQGEKGWQMMRAAQQACLRHAVHLYWRSVRCGRPLSLPNLRRIFQRCWSRRRAALVARGMTLDDRAVVEHAVETVKRLL